MSEPAKIRELLDQWELHNRQIPVEHLCRDCPELISELSQRIKAIQGEQPTITPTPHPSTKDQAYQNASADEEATIRPIPGSNLIPRSPTPPPPPVQVRLQQFGDFELLGELARGGLGIVYKARQISIHRMVALKMILREERADSGDIERFHREAEAVASLEHPGIVPIYEAGVREGKHYIAMGLVEGGSLAQLLSVDGPQSNGESARLIREIALAVAHAHDHGVIHRDLKPANVLLTPDRQPKIIDFGLARRGHESSLTATGLVMGTPSYMAPEQALGKNDVVGPASDIWSLGALLYSLLTGRPPFNAATPAETMRQVVEDAPTPPRQLNPDVATDLETICLKCLEKEPHRRYSSAAELGEDLARFQSGEAILARPITGMEKLLRWTQKNPGMSALTVALILTLLLGFILTFRGWRRAVDLTEQTVTAKARAEKALAQAKREEKDRVIAQVEALLNANPQSVKTLLRHLEPFRKTILPRLRDELAQPGTSDQHRLRAALGLLPSDPKQVPFLREQMLSEQVDPEEALLIRDLLATKHDWELTPGLWKEVHKPHGDRKRRFRCLIALASYDPDNPNWQTRADDLVEELFKKNALLVGIWSRGLGPVRSHLREPLLQRFRDREIRGARRELAFSLLLDFFRIDPMFWQRF